MMPAARVAHAADAFEVGHHARDKQLRVDGPGHRRDLRQRLPRPLRRPARTSGRRGPQAPTAGSASVGGVGRCHRVAARQSARIEPHGQPIARSLEGMPGAQPDRRRRPATRQPWSRPQRRPGECPRGSRRRPRAGARRRDARGDRAEDIGVHRRPAPGAIEVDHVDEGAPGPTKCSAIRSGRSVQGADAGETPGQKTIRDRPCSTSIAGMICTRSGGEVGEVGRPGGRAPSPSRARRWKLMGGEPPRRSVSWNARSEKASPRRRCSSARSSSSRTLPRR